MSRGFLASFAAIPAIVFTVAALVPIPAAGQTAATARRVAAAEVTNAWTPPRTPDGQPDLQGVWVNLSATPFERPKALADRPFLSDEEVAELKRRADRPFKDGNADLPIDDRTTWTRPWTAAIRLTRTQAEIYEFACHEGNQDAMLSILANTRAEEKAGPR